jgi:hypothetical protein
MSRPWIRSLSLLAVAATSSAGVLGVDSLGAYLAHDRQVVSRQSVATSTPLDLTTIGTVKGRPIETFRLQQQRMQAATQRAAKLKAERRSAAQRADRARRLATPSAARDLGRQMAAARGWGATQFSCLDALWTNESEWEVHAQNASGAYGIPQALPGPRMADAGSDWRGNPVTQIRWGLDYIGQRRGTPCGAWAYWRAHRWY